MKRVLGAFAWILFSYATAAAPAKLIRHAQGVPETYIVVLTDAIAPPAVNGVARSLAASYKVSLKAVWPDAPRGFLATGNETNFAAMTNDPRVKYIEQDARLAPPTSRVSGMYLYMPDEHYKYWHLTALTTRRCRN